MISFFKLLETPDNSTISRTEKTAALSIANFTNTVLSVVYTMVASRVLSKADIALQSQTLLAFTTFYPFLLLGLNQGIYYFIARDNNRKRAIIKEALLLSLISSFVYSTFVLCGGSVLLSQLFKSESLQDLIYWMVPYSFFMIPIAVLDCVFVFENRLRFNAVYQVVKTFISLVVTTASVLVFKTAQAAISSQVIITGCFAVLTFVIAVRYLIPHDDGQMTKSSIKAILGMSIPLCIASALGTLSTNLDKWIISSMRSPEEYAIYTRGAHELPLIGTVLAAITTVIMVDMTKSAKNNDYDNALILFKKCAEKTSLFLFPIGVYLLVAADSFIRVLYSDSYADAVPIFRIYLLYIPIRTVFYGPFMIALGKSKQVLYRTIIGLVVNAVLSYFLVLWVGSSGAAIATIISVYTVNIPINLYVISKSINVKWYLILPIKSYAKNVIYCVPGFIILVGLFSFTWFKTLNDITKLGVSFFVYFIIVSFTIIRGNGLSVKVVVSHAFGRIKQVFIK